MTGRRDGLMVKVAWCCFAVTGFSNVTKISPRITCFVYNASFSTMFIYDVLRSVESSELWKSLTVAVEGIVIRLNKLGTKPVVKPALWSDNFKSPMLSNSVGGKRPRSDLIDNHSGNDKNVDKTGVHKENDNPWLTVPKPSRSTKFQRHPARLVIRSSCLLIVFNTNHGKFCFSNRVVELWNGLDADIVMAKDVETFKMKLDRHMNSTNMMFNWRSSLGQMP
ncbi:hypothetical protein HELRODRAFT_160171 [Helobdella robusta]|uniref:Uncharacterized protein n=1 Tax=Helobdella robusta TaxID=6412 RepID=T1EPX1_HELRO|nr:hypothetical protein HELRODRAFT_160171 [Helobdella robusta]ESO06048.1 hypothetical protein HELRODRAFT_160171 [Helobdella robusta]